MHFISYGKPGVEYEAELETEVRQLAFVPGRGQLILLTEDSTIQLWEINAVGGEEKEGQIAAGGRLDKVRVSDHFANEQREGSLKQLTTLTVHSSGDVVFAGTQGGNIYVLNVDTLELYDQLIYQDVILQNVPDEYKKNNVGDVEVIAEQPGQPDKLLVGYNRGLMVLWDNKSLAAEHFYIANQQLETVSWHSDGLKFVSSHNDGSYILWRVTDNLHPSEPGKIPYGPFPCKAMTKVKALNGANGDTFLIFSGGMPRATYGDKHTVSLIQTSPEGEEKKHHALDFTSKVMDFVVINEPTADGHDDPKALVVLAEEEIVLVDLTHPDWLQFKLPYLASVHSSSITCCQHYSDVPDDVFKQVLEAGRRQNESKYTTANWPISGGRVEERAFVKTNDLLITGHEDGSVRFWDASDTNMYHIYTVSTAKLFLASDDDIPAIDGDDVSPLGGDGDVESEWPPFRKVGTFDPYSDDPRLAIRKVILCPMSGVLVAAGTAGQVIIFTLHREATEKQLQVEQLSVVEDKHAFVWKGHDQLHTRQGAIKLDVGHQPQAILQITPPAAVTAIALHSEWSLVAAGTAHGFGLFDYAQNKVVLSKSTLNPADLTSTAGGDALISRRKSFKKSLRESFRRLRKGRSTRKTKSGSSSPTPTASSPSKSDEVVPSKATSPARTFASEDNDTRPVERQIEARTDDGMGSVIRTLYLAPAALASNSTPAPTLWVGTNAGAIYVHAIGLPSEDKRASDLVTCQLGKEIQLKHRAPVIFIQVVDSSGYPIPNAFEVEKGKLKAPLTVGSSRVLIASEEQFKLFTLPSLKPYCKSKLTAHEGSRARKVAVADFVSKSDDKHIEHCMLCMSNQGEVTVYTIPDLKRQQHYSCVKREDIHGMSSLVFTRTGEGLYLHSPSEYKRFSLSARRLVSPTGSVDIPEGARPVKASDLPPPIAAASVEEETQPEKKKEDEEGTKKLKGGDGVGHGASTDQTAKLSATLLTSAQQTTDSVSEPPSSGKSISDKGPVATELASSVLSEAIALEVKEELEIKPIISTLAAAAEEAAIAVDLVVPVPDLEPLDLLIGQYNGEAAHITNGQLNGHNGVNGGGNDNEDDHEDEDDEDDNVDQSNGNVEIDTNVNMSNLTTDSSTMGLDITIDSVKDHMQ